MPGLFRGRLRMKDPDTLVIVSVIVIEGEPLGAVIQVAVPRLRSDRCGDRSAGSPGDRSVQGGCRPSGEA